ncbi:ABC transporter permease subunit [Methylobacterium planeticum]|uniref:ABC transporter permease subunit n=1 Tax=Methylobacterium planeticum TaxID=2615211 RepID=UPI001FED3410|nr:ABC transporter permease subunit [Methylobacterium planeticum]
MAENLSFLAPMRILRGTDPGRVAAILAAIAVIGALYGLPLLRLAANRLVVGDPVFAGESFGAEIHAAAGLTVAATLIFGGSRSEIGGAGAVTLLLSAFALLTLGLGSTAADLLSGEPPAARASLASGAWLAFACLAVALAIAVGRASRPWLGALAAGGAVLILVVAGRSGALDGLSLAVELRARREAVLTAILQHGLLSGGALLLGALGAGLLAAWRRAQGLVEILVGGIQVVPAVALLGVLVTLASGALHAWPQLRGLGLSALGPVPALIGIAAYLLLPLWRGVTLALRAPDAATLDAATALGLRPRQILAQVRLPLGAPVLIGALRVAAVQSIGLATLGALVGAGGLGQIVFEGMAQFAPDLILLGAIPVIALSLAVESGLARAEAAARRWSA